mgnify:FL=1
MSENARAVLEYLFKAMLSDDNVSVADIAGDIGISNRSVNGIVTALGNKKLVFRDKSNDDGVSYIRLTEIGSDKKN